MDESTRQALAPTGALRAVINLGNPVLAQGDEDDPRGVTVDLARELAGRLGVPAELVCVRAARESLAAVADGRVDVGFLAVDPGRAEQVFFTEPYALIEGVYAAREDSGIDSAEEVDRAGVRVGVKQGSAYDLHLTRALEHAEIVRGAEGTAVFAEQGLEVAAGIRQPVAAFAAEQGRLRVLEPAFMQIRQAMAVAVGRPEAAKDALSAFVADVIASGFVEDSLRRSGQDAAVPRAGSDAAGA